MRRTRCLTRVFTVAALLAALGVLVVLYRSPEDIGDLFRDDESIDWRNLVFASSDEYTNIVDQPSCQIVFEDPLPLEWIERLFDRQALHCGPPHDKRPLFDRVISNERSCPLFREDVLHIDYGLVPDQIKCEYFEISDGISIAADIRSQFQFGTGKPFKFNECPDDLEQGWIVCEMGSSPTRYMQPLLLTKIHGLKTHSPPKSDGLFHVLVLQIDSVSRLAFQRTMPNTQRKLEASFGDRLIPLYGYNKVGDNLASLNIPLLSGAPFWADDARNMYFDNWTKFIWEDFSEREYRTMLLEETPNRSMFTYDGRLGFRKPPTDYFPMRFISTIENAYKADGCAFNRPTAKLLLDYVHDTMKILTHRRPLFAYTRLSRLTENDLSGGVLLDDVLAEFFDELEISGVLEHTMVFFISDHGSNTNRYSLSRQGRHEEMLPFAFILPPATFLRDNESFLLHNAEVNSRRLTSPLDVFATLVDIAGSDVANRTYHGISLFSTEISSQRRCDKAGIFGAYCSCYNGHDVNNPQLEHWFRRLLIERINKILDDDFENKCARYVGVIETIRFEQIYEGRLPLNKYRIRARLQPPAEFEGLFEKQGKSAELEFVERTDDAFRRGCARLPKNEQICYC